MKKGFTLIELLIVVTIIALIASVVVISVDTAKSKGDDATVKADVTQMAKEAEIYYGNNNESYGTFAQAACPTATGGGTDTFSNDSVMVAIIAHATNAGGNGSSCSSIAGAYAVSVGLRTSGLSWCADNTGVVKQYTGTPADSITNSKCN